MHDLTELKRQVGYLDECTRKLEILLEPAYGGAIGELVRLLQAQETRDATAISRLAELEAELGLAKAETVFAQSAAGHLRDHIDELTRLINRMDHLAPMADNSCLEPGITLSEACRRMLAEESASWPSPNAEDPQ
jgi:hypothetical protein